MLRTVMAMGCVFLIACGGDATVAGDTSNGGNGQGGSAQGGSGQGGQGGNPLPPGDWIDLVQGDWTLASGSEGYTCVLATVPEDMYVAAFRAVAPEGTHHTVVTLSDSTQPDGEFPCDAGTLADEMIFTSGVGTNDVVFPEGVAIKIDAGQRILLNLHLFNVSGSEIGGVSGTQVKVIPEADVEQEAEVIFAGSVLIALSPMSEGSASGACTFNQDATIMSVWPHMHQYGTHMKVTHQGAAGDTVLHDLPFAFSEQINYPIAPQAVSAGESVRVECDYTNTSSQTVTFGDSSEQEMCFAGLYRYPAEKSGVFCDIGF